jgi:hypothetical protein
MKGRCPHCKQTVAIPAANDALSALSAAFGQAQAKPDDTNHAGIPPPPGVGKAPASHEIILSVEGNADLADTVMLPAGVFAEKGEEEEPSQARSRRPVHATALDRHRPALNIVRTILILVAVIVVLIVAVVGYALATRRF